MLAADLSVTLELNFRVLVQVELEDPEASVTNLPDSDLEPWPDSEAVTVVAAAAASQPEPEEKV